MKKKSDSHKQSAKKSSSASRNEPRSNVERKKSNFSQQDKGKAHQSGFTEPSRSHEAGEFPEQTIGVP
jgi:hypothetical protein